MDNLRKFVSIIYIISSNILFVIFISSIIGAAEAIAVKYLLLWIFNITITKNTFLIMFTIFAFLRLTDVRQKEEVQNEYR